jgi:hypothetical protein
MQILSSFLFVLRSLLLDCGMPESYVDSVYTTIYVNVGIPAIGSAEGMKQIKSLYLHISRRTRLNFRSGYPLGACRKYNKNCIYASFERFLFAYIK